MILEAVPVPILQCSTMESREKPKIHSDLISSGLSSLKAHILIMWNWNRNGPVGGRRFYGNAEDDPLLSGYTYVRAF
ncbi:MAG TPA: hypothetical protein VJ729_00120 [Nitrososphaeraceae archaeon]|nr:hypothetical protein [Nitrososphaeraceae archaeon]